VEALGIPLLRGRALTAADLADAPRVLLVNEAFAARAWPGEDPLGKTVGITLDQRPAVVAGVVRNVRHVGLDSPFQPEVYVPYAVDPWPSMTVVIRGRIPPDRLVGALREAVTSMDADQPLARVSTMEDRIAGSLAARRFTMTLLAIAAGIALALALVGIYAMVAHAVAQRRQELGIRLALGAPPRRLLGSVVASALRPVAAGVAAGVALALVVTRAMAALVFGVATNDAATFAAIALLAAGSAALASLLAARQVTSVNPVEVLRRG
jgi:predicted lysophospholipase L1 biosynthesis ABC-type transport system permease subunit